LRAVTKKLQNAAMQICRIILCIASLAAVSTYEHHSLACDAFNFSSRLFIKVLGRCPFGSIIHLEQGSPMWCPRAPGRPQGPCRSPAGLFEKWH